MSEFMAEEDQSWARGAATWVPDMADEAEPDTWTSPVPLVLTVDGETAIQAENPDRPVPFVLTPQDEAAAAEPDTWTRREPGPSLVDVVREWAAEPEPGA